MATADKAAEEHGGPEKRAPLPTFPGQDALLHEAVKGGYGGEECTIFQYPV